MLRLALLAVFFAAGACAQPDSFIITSRLTRTGLNGLRLLNDGTLLYADNYGVYRVRGQQSETLLANPVQEGYCYARMFGFYCVVWIPAVYHPKPMAADSTGTIYIADPEQHVIQRYDQSSRAFLTVASGIGTPTVLATDDYGSVYFNDPESCRVRRLSRGTIETVAGVEACAVRALAVDSGGRLYLAGGAAGTVRRLDTDGTVATLAEHLNGPAGLALDPAGTLYIAEAGGNRVLMVDADGALRTMAGSGETGHAGDYRPALSAQLTAPGCLAVDPSGKLRICDSDRIRKLIPAAERWIGPVVKGPDAISRFNPGSWVTVLGEFEAGGVMADLSGKPCEVAYATADRIDLRLPPELDGFYWSLPLRLTMQSGASWIYNIGIGNAAPEFLMKVVNGKLYPSSPALAGDEIRLYATGLNVTEPTAPPYDVSRPGGMQVVIGSLGHAVLLAVPYSPGVTALAVRLLPQLPAGELPMRLFAGGMSTMPAVLTISPPAPASPGTN